MAESRGALVTGAGHGIGRADASAPLPQTGSRTAALIPDCRLVVYESAPHGLDLSHRDRLKRDLLGFIDGRDNRQTTDDGHAVAV